MANFQKLVRAGSAYHRLFSGETFTHAPDGKPSQQFLGSLTRLTHTEREQNGKVDVYISGRLTLDPAELDTPVTRFSKFKRLVDGVIFNVDDLADWDKSGVLWDVPIYSSDPVRIGPSEGYKRELLGA